MKSDSKPWPSKKKAGRKALYEKLINELSAKGIKVDSTANDEQRKLKLEFPDGNTYEIGLTNYWKKIDKGEKESDVLASILESVDELGKIRSVKLKENMDRIVVKPISITESFRKYFKVLGKDSRTSDSSPVVLDITDNLHMLFAIDLPNSQITIPLGMCKGEGIAIEDVFRSAFSNAKKKVEGWMENDQIDVMKSGNGVLVVSAAIKSETPSLIMHLHTLMPVFRAALGSQSDNLRLYLPNPQVILVSELDNKAVNGIAQEVYSKNPQPLCPWSFILSDAKFEEAPTYVRLTDKQLELFRICSERMKDAMEKPGKSSMDKADESIDAFFGACTDAPEKNYYVQRAYLFRGRISVFRGEYSKTVEALEKIENVYMHASEVMYLLGQCHEKLGNPEKAWDYYSKTTIFRPSGAETYFRMAQLDMDKRPERAVECLDMTILLNPKSSEAFSKRGIAYANMGNKTKAIQDLNQAMKLDPKNDEASKELLKLK